MTQDFEERVLGRARVAKLSDRGGGFLQHSMFRSLRNGFLFLSVAARPLTLASPQLGAGLPLSLPAERDVLVPVRESNIPSDYAVYMER